MDAAWRYLARHSIVVAWCLAFTDYLRVRASDHLENIAVGERQASEEILGGSEPGDDFADHTERLSIITPATALTPRSPLWNRASNDPSTSTSERQPPHNLEVEQALLGAILVNNEALQHVSGFLSPDHFFDALHGRIYEILATLIQAGKSTTPVTVKTFFENFAPIQSVDWETGLPRELTVPQYLGRLAKEATTIINAAEYGRTIYDLAARRLIILATSDTMDAAYNSAPAISALDVLSQHEISLEMLRRSVGATTAETLIELAEDSKIEDDAEDVIKGLIPPKSVGFLYSPSGLGKTFLALHAGSKIAGGTPFLGRPTTRGAVLYVALEGGGRIGRRLRAAISGYELPPRTVARLLKGIVLGRASEADVGVATIIEAAKQLAKIADIPVRLIVIDTLAKALAGDDENEAAAISAVISQSTKIAVHTGASVLIVHHPGKDAQRGMRGSYSLYADADFVLRVDGEKGQEAKSLFLEKAKDDEDGVIVGAFKLEKVTLGRNRYGNEITSMIVKPLDQVQSSSRMIKRPCIETQTGRALIELEHLFASAECKSVEHHDRIPAGTLVVSKEDWRSACRRKQLSADGGEAAEIQAFKRAHKSLSKSGLIGSFDGLIWLIGTGDKQS